MKQSNPIKWHGGKWYLAQRIIAMMPAHTHYVEPYAGGLAVLLAKPPEGVSEVVNDIHGGLTNFWRCLAYPLSFGEFARQAQALPVGEKIWQEAMEKLSKPCNRQKVSGFPEEICVPCALAFFVACRQSLAGRMKSFTPLSKTRVRRGMNEQASAWLSAVEDLPLAHARLSRVAILNRRAVDVIQEQDGPETFFYLDPPYLHETRATTSDYEFEMTYEQHAELLGVLRCIRGKFLLSGYPSELYKTYALANHWNRVDIDCANNAAGGDDKRRMIESIWSNF